jgi:hypothetical protein
MAEQPVQIPTGDIQAAQAVLSNPVEANQAAQSETPPTPTAQQPHVVSNEEPTVQQPTAVPSASGEITLEVCNNSLYISPYFCTTLRCLITCQPTLVTFRLNLRTYLI